MKPKLWIFANAKNFRLSKVSFILLGLLLNFALNANAGDKQSAVTLKNGDVIRGQVIEQKFNDSIQIKMNDGNEKHILWGEIKDIKQEEIFQTKKTRSKNVILPLGVATMGLTYAITAVSCISNCELSKYPLIPIFGPFIAVAGGYSHGTATTTLIISGVAQAAGAVLTIVGLVNRNDDNTSAIFTPIVSPDELKMAVAFKF